MKFIPIKTRIFLPPQDNIFELLDRLPRLQEEDIICISSKVLAIAQGRCVKIKSSTQKDKLVKQEADAYLPGRIKIKNTWLRLTIKDYTLIPTAGIDESNGNGYYVLWPTKTNTFLKKLWYYIRTKHGIKNLGVMAVDSHTTPLRRGVLGISTGLYGFHPLVSHVGKPDIFSRRLKFTYSNACDALAATAVYIMGESAEQTPFLIIRGAPHIQFTNTATHQHLVIPPRRDIYYPILKQFKSTKNSNPQSSQYTSISHGREK